MNEDKNNNREFATGKILDISFSDGKKMIEAKACVKEISGDFLVIALEKTDKNITIPVNADIHISKEGKLFNVLDSKGFPEIKIEEVTNRKNVRVDDILRIDYKKVSKDIYEKYQDVPEILFVNIFGESLKIPEIEDVENTLLYELLYQTNLKLDRILDILEGKEGREYKSTASEYIANISGSGVRFISDQKFEIKDTIAIRISLSLVSQTRLNLLGEVVSVKETDIAGKHSISVHFLDLTEDDHEKIVKYVFKKQRELLRGINK